MKKLLVLSGKGGTGKTTVASAIIGFSKSPAFADCDVDAPNLHLVSGFSKVFAEKEFLGSEKATIDGDKCIKCGKCMKNCRFGAIKELGGTYKADEYACEGCGVCEFICPVGAALLKDDVAGKTRVFKEDRVFSTARLKMGRGNSGKLVTEVKKNLFSNVDIREDALCVIDGAPGIGCPVIASSSGVDMALIVAEPSVSGISDMERLFKVLKSFGVKTMVCVNKADVAPGKTAEIRAWCENEQIEFAGEIPYDETVIRAVNSGRDISGYESPARNAIYEIYKRITASKAVDL